jgi:hypothetical protein
LATPLDQKNARDLNSGRLEPITLGMAEKNLAGLIQGAAADELELDEFDLDLAGMFELQANGGPAVSATVFTDGQVVLTQRDHSGQIHNIRTTTDLLRQLTAATEPRC